MDSVEVIDSSGFGSGFELRNEGMSCGCGEMRDKTDGSFTLCQFSVTSALTERDDEISRFRIVSRGENRYSSRSD